MYIFVHSLRNEAFTVNLSYSEQPRERAPWLKWLIPNCGRGLKAGREDISRARPAPRSPISRWCCQTAQQARSSTSSHAADVVVSFGGSSPPQIAEGGGLDSIGTGLKSNIGTRSSVMLHNPIFINNEDNQAIRREIGERLRLELGIELELPAGLKGKLDELRWLEGQSFSIVPEAEFENKPSTNIPKLLADGPATATGDSDFEYGLYGHHRYYGL